MLLSKIEKIISKESLKYLLDHKPIIDKDILIKPKDVLTFKKDSLNNRVLKNLGSLYSSGQLNNSGFLSILPIDHGIEHGASKSFNNTLELFGSDGIFELALQLGASSVVAPLNVLKFGAKNYINKIPFIVKLNHNDLLSNNLPNQSFYSSVQEAYELGASGIAATLYLGDDTKENIENIRKAFEEAHNKGMFTILWTYLRNNKFVQKQDFHFAADMSAQANYVGTLVGADIIKQKIPMFPFGFRDVKQSMHEDGLVTDHPVDMVRLQVLHCMQGGIPLLNSGGSSSDDNMKDIVTSALVNKLAGGSGLMAGRKLFKNPEESLKLSELVHEIYLSNEIEAI